MALPVLRDIPDVADAGWGASSIARLLACGRDGSPWDGAADAAFVAAASRQNLAPLVYRALHRTGAWDRQSNGVRDTLSQAAAEAAMLDRLRVDTDVRVVTALADAGVDTLLFKGAALAHTHY